MKISEPKYGHSINLWELIVHRAVNDKPEFNDIQFALGQSASMHYQELSITPTRLGWIIEVFSCDETGRVKILIPADPSKPAKILCDTRASSEYRG